MSVIAWLASLKCYTARCELLLQAMIELGVRGIWRPHGTNDDSDWSFDWHRPATCTFMDGTPQVVSSSVEKPCVIESPSFCRWKLTLCSGTYRVVISLSYRSFFCKRSLSCRGLGYFINVDDWLINLGYVFIYLFGWLIECLISASGKK